MFKSFDSEDSYLVAAYSTDCYLGIIPIVFTVISTDL